MDLLFLDFFLDSVGLAAENTTGFFEFSSDTVSSGASMFLELSTIIVQIRAHILGRLVYLSLGLLDLLFNGFWRFRDAK